MSQSFPDFFAQLNSGRSPYDYQQRLAESECESRLISVPTGLGKTAAVVMAWLYNRVHLQDPKWPRRLVYCLPMRTLVEQTRDCCRHWLKEMGNREWDPKADKGHTGKVGLHILMGGEETVDWDLYPEENAILIGTQDMLLSRALNRGYGMSRYRWPMHFGLLNNDCLWGLDETQLMGVGVETSAQLDGFRHLAQWKKEGRCPTWWMSATLENGRLATVDHPVPAEGWPKVELSIEELQSDAVRQKVEARKPVTKSRYVLESKTKDAHAKELASLIKDKHVEGTLTLVVVNRVIRARKLYAALRDKRLGVKSENIALIHSRFRPVDRERHSKVLFGKGDRIVIATQAVEAGVDVSARLLISELAPWSSIVQRIGRCNRYGDIADAEFIWVDVAPKDEKDELVLPYSIEELARSRAALQKLNDVGPQSLSGVSVAEVPVIRPVIRRRDLLDLFDTTPDLCGQDLDISRYIRDGEDNDVQFFWRDISEKAVPTEKEPAPARHELCRVPRQEAAKFIKNNKGRVWTWNALEERWEAADYARSGAIYLIATDCGGYHDELGWTGDAKDRLKPLLPNTNSEESYKDDPLSRKGYWLSYDAHVKNVVTQTDALVAALGLDAPLAAAFHIAAFWHDVGKTHEIFQTLLCGDASGLDAHSRRSLRINRAVSLKVALASVMNLPPLSPGSPAIPKLSIAISLPISLLRIMERYASPFARCLMRKATEANPSASSLGVCGIATNYLRSQALPLTQPFLI
ncbi:type I-G CRISPR-associated helicase/endonuclease Cas3g [Verrucomicrobium spinosum]|uniref:type I-G CRISPR-associated helicase/endonuclease Cas3g n=1 Tax=Verrucomicrobium spinosum TaxID=2736 RepID=UPI0009EC1CC1|nr:helicase-related protein [Verrucomicrobium spinosum]